MELTRNTALVRTECKLMFGLQVCLPPHNFTVEVAGLADEVEIEAAPGMLTIRPSTHPRAVWAEPAAAFDPDGLLDQLTSTRFDHEEWSW